jgi:hypothetical protein
VWCASGLVRTPWTTHVGFTPLRRQPREQPDFPLVFPARTHSPSPELCRQSRSPAVAQSDRSPPWTRRTDLPIAGRSRFHRAGRCRGDRECCSRGRTPPDGSAKTGGGVPHPLSAAPGERAKCHGRLPHCIFVPAQPVRQRGRAMIVVGEAGVRGPIERYTTKLRALLSDLQDLEGLRPSSWCKFGCV